MCLSAKLVSRRLSKLYYASNMHVGVACGGMWWHVGVACGGMWWHVVVCWSGMWWHVACGGMPLSHATMGTVMPAGQRRDSVIGTVSCHMVACESGMREMSVSFGFISVENHRHRQ